MRGTKDLTSGRYGFSLVGAWTHYDGLCLAQSKVREKTNVIRALPEIIKLFDIEDYVLTIDATGTKRVIAESLVHELHL